jgi:hypothetical protein
MQRTERTTRTLAALGVLVVLAMLLPALAATAQAASVAPRGTPSAALTANFSTTQQWAYGGSKWVNVSVQLGNGSYNSHAFFGWHVILTATNTSSSTVALEAQRTMGASLFASYCVPNCTHPSTAGNLTLRGYESDTGFANLTSLAQVYENGTAATALGIDNASSRGYARLNETYSLTVGGHTATGDLRIRGGAHGQVAFTPALGLVPWNLGPGVTWNSTAAYVASGAWSVAYQYNATSFLGTTMSGSGTPNGSVSSSGTVALTGAELGSVTLANGHTVQVIGIAITGPFDAVDGFILVPHGFEIFGSGHHDWDPHSFGAEAVATSRLDVAVDATGRHLQVEASATAYAGSDGSLNQGTTVANAAPVSAAPSTALVQGQPETVADAQHASSCLNTACPAGSASSAAGSILSLLVVGLVVGLVAVVLVGTVGVVEYRAWMRRRGGGGTLVGGYSQQVPMTPGLPAPPGGPSPPVPPPGAL